MRISQLLRLSLASVVLASAAAAVLPAQKIEVSGQRLGPPPKRPKTSAVTDTNDARQYLDFATAVFDKDPNASASGFYWAARIDPTSGAALYGRSMALTLGNRTLLTNAWNGTSRRSQSKEQRAVDSLQLRARMIDPFLYNGLFLRMLKGALSQESGGGDLAIQYDFDNMLRTADPYIRGIVAYNEGQFPRALQLFGDAMKSSKEKAGYRIERARIFAMTNEPDSAIAEFNLALDELRKQDKKDLVFLYNSKAVLEHSIGALLERSQKNANAREAYGKALQEDLSYYPAHMRLGLLSIDAGDTTTALSELDLAANIATDEPHVHFTYGFALSRFGKTAEAIKELNKAIALEPYYARPYEVLGEVLEKTGDRAGAAAAYDKFLMYASQRDVSRASVTQKRAALGKSLEHEMLQ